MHKAQGYDGNEEWHCDCGEELKYILEKIQRVEVERSTPITDVTIRNGRYHFTYDDELSMNVDISKPKSIGIQCRNCGKEYTTAQVIDIFLGRVDD